MCHYLMQTMHKPIVFHVPGAVGELNNTATLEFAVYSRTSVQSMTNCVNRSGFLKH